MTRDLSAMYEARGWTAATRRDLAVLREQLGREPRAIAAVAARCRCGEPQVVVNRPISVDADGRFTVFPTVFWLSSPYLVRAVSALEAEGWIARLRERLNDPEWARALSAAHAATAKLRLELCSGEELKALRATSPRQYRVLAESGVAGMRGELGVKCLHAHLADYLARKEATPEAVNPIGREVAKLLLLRGIDLRGDCLPGTGRVGAIDVGSNSVRLWVGEWRAQADPGASTAREPANRPVREREPHLVPVWRDLATTRLGAGVGAGEPMRREAMDATIDAIAAFARRAAELGSAPLAGLATSAVRDAANGGDLLLRIWEETGQSVPAISGEREAELSFLGVARSLYRGGEAGSCPPLWVIDVGGRSTEIVAGDAGGAIGWRRSFPLGAVRLTERCIASDPVSREELAALRSIVRDALAAERLEAARAALCQDGTTRVVAVGGTATTAAAVGLGLVRYDHDAVHGSRWQKEYLESLIDRLAALPLDERKQVAGLAPQRADIIVAGLVILDECLAALGATEFVVSEADLLQGLLHRLNRTTA